MAANVKVLVVEDSKFLRIANERILMRAGFEVSTAADGEEALRMVMEKQFDVILLDLLIPKISGPEVLKRLKENPATLHIPVIVLSGLSQRNEEKLLKDGAVAYFEKGVLDLEHHSDRLVTAVESALRQAESRR